jgi:hypothetical protein
MWQPDPLTHRAVPIPTFRLRLRSDRYPIPLVDPILHRWLPCEVAAAAAVNQDPPRTGAILLFLDLHVKHIVIEFTSPASRTQAASQDKWLFPEYAVLDASLSGRGLEMVRSFFVIRKGSQIISALYGTGGGGGNDAIQPATVSAAQKWKPNEEYLQPVTMTLRAPAHRIKPSIRMQLRVISKNSMQTLNLYIRRPNQPQRSWCKLGSPWRPRMYSPFQMRNSSGSQVRKFAAASVPHAPPNPAL